MLSSQVRGREKSKAVRMGAKKTPNRAGTVFVQPGSTPKTFKERLCVRRLELRLTQQQVADQVTFTYNTGHDAGKTFRLSRSAYCTYETGETEPSLHNILGIAKALQVTPEWLAFGTGARHCINEFTYDSAKNAFRPQVEWVIPHEWAENAFGVSPNDLALYRVDEYSGNFKPGDVAVVAVSATPTTSGDYFIFAAKKTAPKMARVARNARTEQIRIFTNDRNDYVDTKPAEVRLLGQVVGRIGAP